MIGYPYIELGYDILQEEAKGLDPTDGQRGFKASAYSRAAPPTILSR